MQLYFSTTKLKIHSIIVTRTGVLKLKGKQQSSLTSRCYKIKKMTVRNKIYYSDGVYFITFTCAQLLQLFTITNGYQAVYNWFDYLTSQMHYITGYVIKPHHVHAIIAFGNTGKTINNIIGNGKRFMAYHLVDLLQKQSNTDILNQMELMVNNTDKQNNKKHELFEPSFDRKECRTIEFI